MDAVIAVITETWLADGKTLDEDVTDLSLGAGIGFIYRNRPQGPSGVAHGGVAISYKNSCCRLSRLELQNPQDFEVVVAGGKINGYSRQVVVVAVYIPPNYTVGRGRDCVRYVEDVIIEIKRRYRDPFVVLAGDFNQWAIQDAVADFADISEESVGPTRKDKQIDRIFTNFHRAVIESGTVQPLTSDETGTSSDHRVAFVRADLPRVRSFQWLTYSYRYRNEESTDQFGAWLASFDWSGMFDLQGSNKKAEYYQETVTSALERYFPLVRVRRKTTDCPWISKGVIKMIRNRKEIYQREGFSQKWDTLREVIEKKIRDRREKYLQSQRDCLLVDDARRNFFRNVKAFQCKDRPKQFDVRQLFPGCPDGAVAEKLADFFNRISSEFDPLEPSDIPRTHDRSLPLLLPYQVAGRIAAFKKPKSMVVGDIFPSLVSKFGPLLAIPLTNIYNEITTTGIWPKIWKQEFVTVIPKCRNPESLSDLRNISCTMLASKIYESYVLNWLSTEVKCKPNQYGGVKGCSVSHLLVDLWNEIAWNLEDERASTVITSIDYAKAFNRLSFQHCLRAFARKGASTQVLSLLASFLSNRTMSVRVAEAWSKPRPVHGGVPQGSILGVMLFNVATDDLEDEATDDRTFVFSESSPGSSSSPESPFDSSTTSESSSDIRTDEETAPMNEESSRARTSESSSDIWTDEEAPLTNEESPRAETGGSSDIDFSGYVWSDEEDAPRQRMGFGGSPERIQGEGSTEVGPPTVNDSGNEPLGSGPPKTEDPPAGLADPDGDDSDEEPSVAATSTPITALGDRGRARIRESPIRRGPRLSVRDWSFMPGRRNRRRRRNLRKRISYSDEGECTVPLELNKKATGLRWKAKRARKFKYVDDGMIVTKVNMDSGVVSLAAGSKPVKDKHDLIGQNMFRRVVSKAESRGMRVNNKKTKILCVSDALNYLPQAHMIDADGNRLESSDKMKILGFHMSSKPTVHAHVAALQSRMRETVWILRHLGHSGFRQDELVTVYKSVIRPIMDYCCPVYHSMLTDEQDQILERLQAQALKSIYGYKMSYAEMRERAGITTLRARRIDLCDKFARKALGNSRFMVDWFPLEASRRSARNTGPGWDKFKEFTARTDRLNNTPLFYMRRRLNGKEGKKYGERNRKYRD